ncbi:hypothetical protein H6G96_21880 [Nostoc sp. FACHB-892]|uniref:hypothetical protein n=1 Tax=Nostoc sp. FACHB-892 TaxID=2692843 RepID=UPI001685D629|nr:hypothetical protein [Nostoc sp. FACHB-892]MBD2728897.1 hypothetical protein [Nostoc sp. FACHB-892]
MSPIQILLHRRVYCGRFHRLTYHRQNSPLHLASPYQNGKVVRAWLKAFPHKHLSHPFFKNTRK